MARIRALDVRRRLLDEPKNVFVSLFSVSCDPSHIRAVRQNVEWRQIDNSTFQSQTGNTHLCHPKTCGSWVIRASDGVKICGISGARVYPGYVPSLHSDPSSPQFASWHAEQRRIHAIKETEASLRTKKRQSSFDTEASAVLSGDDSAMGDEEDVCTINTPTKRLMTKAIPGSTVDLRERFLDPESWNEHCCH